MYGRQTNHSPASPEWDGADVNPVYNITATKPITKSAARCPEYVDDKIVRIFDEAALAVAFSAFDAAGAMFRKTIDISTRGIIGIEPQSVPQGAMLEFG
ncbi:hypothetical protein HMP09_2365 [Sphingomonas sp. HMP9]|nr:hypothetical protein HMP09_2365 [Sphingomonas sp. HMP9]